MVQNKEYFAFISNKLKNRQAVNCRCCFNVVHLRPSIAASIILFWLSYGALKCIRSAFEEGSKVIRDIRC